MTELLDVTDLSVTYRSGFRRAPLRAVRDVSLSLASGETLAVVGESGSGKSTIAQAILGLTPVSSGKIVFQGDDITHVRAAKRRQFGGDLQAVFQDPYSSLNPVWPVGRSIAEPLRAHPERVSGVTGDLVAQSFIDIGLSPDARSKYPGEFSGGQLQRVAIARALISSPKVVICDEPVSSLDVSVQAQILNLLDDLQRASGVSYLFISHKLTIVRHIAHRILVLYSGAVMEEGPANEITSQPQHPYTQALIASVPLPNPEVQRARRLELLQSVTADVAATPADVLEVGRRSTGSGCPFAARCPHAVDVCWTERPALREGRGGVRVACHLFENLKPVRGFSDSYSFKKEK